MSAGTYTGACLALLLAVCGTVRAHGLLMDVYVTASRIEGEIGFTSGQMASGARVVVSGEDGAMVAEIRTDADGLFVYQPREAKALQFKVDLGAGHVMTRKVGAAAVAKLLDSPVNRTGLQPDSVGQVPAPQPEAVLQAPAPPASPSQPSAPRAHANAAPPARVAAGGGGMTVSAAELAELLRAEVAPLRRQLRELRTQQQLRDIVGGIGYIAGLFGVGFYMAARRERRKTST